MMESDYAYAGDTATDTKPLEGLSGIAEEAERTATLLSAFITRFRHGSLPPTSGDKAAMRIVSSGHAGQIERLRDAVSSLDKLTRDLNTLG